MSSTKAKRAVSLLALLAATTLIGALVVQLQVGTMDPAFATAGGNGASAKPAAPFLGGLLAARLRPA